MTGQLVDVDQDVNQVKRTAALSPCGHYRYWLTREWASGPRVTFVMLNPSTADADRDDQTIRRCVGYARSWGYAGLIVVNLYAWRSTSPRALWAAPDPVGPANDGYLLGAASLALMHRSPLVAAWGANARPERVAAVRAISGMHWLSTLALTKDGQPRHPLRLRADLIPVPLLAAEAGSMRDDANPLKRETGHVDLRGSEERSGDDGRAA